MHVLRVAVMAVVVMLPGVAFAQLAPQSQAEFEQRFTGWIVQFDDAPDCNGLDPLTFIAPGRFDTNEYDEGDYEYQGTGANTGTLTLRFDSSPTPQVLALTFNSQTMGTFTLEASCGGRFEFVDPTLDTTPPSLVRAVVYFDDITLTFDERLGRIFDRDFFGGGLSLDAFSVTVDGESVSFVGFGVSSASLNILLSTPITRGQTVVVSYTDPTPGDDEFAIQDAAGNDAASFTENVINNSTAEPVPALPLAGVGLLGLLLAGLGGWMSRARVC